VVFTKKIRGTTFVNIEDNKKCYYQHIRMISEGSFDTEDWSNHAENSALSLQE